MYQHVNQDTCVSVRKFWRRSSSVCPLCLFASYLYLSSPTSFSLSRTTTPVREKERAGREKTDRERARARSRQRGGGEEERDGEPRRTIISSVTSAYLINMCIEVVAWRVFRAIIEPANGATFNQRRHTPRVLRLAGVACVVDRSNVRVALSVFGARVASGSTLP